MTQEGITQIDIQQVLRQKAPSVARKIPGFMVDYLIRTVHQDELNEILRRYHDKDGVAFMQELIGYFDLNLELVNERRTDRKGIRFGQPDHHISRRFMLTQTKREDTGHRMEEVVYPKGRGIPAGHRTGVFRRT